MTEEKTARLASLPTRGRHLAALAGLAALLACAGCGLMVDDVTRGGDGTETGNAFGTLVLEDGGGAAGARVALVPEGYHPVYGDALPDSLRDTADSRGFYGFNAPPGRYNLQAVHPATGRRILLQGLVIGDDTLRLQKDTVRVPGTFSFARPDWAPKEGGFLYVPGTLYRLSLELARRDGARYLFDSLPPGLLGEVRYVTGVPDTASLLMAREPLVRSAEVVRVHPFAAWSRSARVLVNTTSAGVPIQSDLRGFPLLVRLPAPLFDLAEAQADGRDLRFAKPDGSALPFEIEAWERGNAMAWVRMDTVAAGESGQHITVHWGNPQAALPAGMPPVFDTAAGFAGVWHLRESAADTVTDRLYLDATPAGNHGNDRILSTGNPGVVGAGQSFAKGDYFQAAKASGAVRLAGGYSLSTWFRSQLQTGRKGGELISVGDNYGLRLGEDGRLHTFFWPAKAPPGGQDPWYTVNTQGADFLDGNWHLAMGTYDGHILRLFLDGREMAALAVPGPVDFKFDLNVTLGKHGAGQTGFEYTGDLDEVQIHSMARGVDWNRLSYENQKPGSGFPVLTVP